MAERRMIWENIEQAPEDVREYLDEGNCKDDLIDMLWSALSPANREVLLREVETSKAEQEG